ncbi:MAG TPA: hypothetical protein VEA69_11235 [Tepidisphaeraceae bacterium]|nr:hypothetical protein [Tepidisphaeraceae bacterium]
MHTDPVAVPEAPLSFNCPACGRGITARAADVGKRGQCQDCGHVFAIGQPPPPAGPIVAECPHCQARHSLPAAAAGRKAKCRCGNAFVVQPAATPAAAPIRPAPPPLPGRPITAPRDPDVAMGSLAAAVSSGRAKAPAPPASRNRRGWLVGGGLAGVMVAAAVGAYVAFRPPSPAHEANADPTAVRPAVAAGEGPQALPGTSPAAAPPATPPARPATKAGLDHRAYFPLTQGAQWTYRLTVPTGASIPHKPYMINAMGLIGTNSTHGSMRWAGGSPVTFTVRVAEVYPAKNAAEWQGVRVEISEHGRSLWLPPIKLATLDFGAYARPGKSFGLDVDGMTKPDGIGVGRSLFRLEGDGPAEYRDVTVPAGAFAGALYGTQKHYRNEPYTEPFDEEAWAAPGVGLVKHVITQDGRAVATVELVGYTPGK